MKTPQKVPVAGFAEVSQDTLSTNQSSPQHGGMAKPALMHIFKPGRQVTAAGIALEFSDADLMATAAAYDPAKHEAPITVGHPRNDLPAYGWIGGLQADARGLHAQRRQVEPQFAELVRSGRLKKVSAAFYAPDSPRNPVPGVYYLRHVAFLGAEPPAVKGLDPVEFADGGEDVLTFAEVEFSDPAFGYIGGAFRALRDWLIEQAGLEKADKVLPDWRVQTIEEMGRDRPDPYTPTQGPAFNEGARTSTQEPAVSEREKQLEAELATARRAAETATQALQATQAATAAAARAARSAEHLQFAEGLCTARKLLPAHKDAVVSVLDAIEGDTPLEFGEGDNKKRTADALREFLNALPQHGLTGTHLATGRRDVPTDGDLEFAEGTRVDEASLQRHREAVALSKEKDIPYFEAARQLASR
jgi:hypothetical protein